MSHVAGLDMVQAKLKRFDDLVKARLDQAIETGAKQMQADMVALVPIRTGKLRALLASNEALKVLVRKGETRAEVGFRTPQMKKQGFRYFYVETGTKGYQAGGTRSAGYDKKGRKRTQRVKRNIPARPAQPFFRPALINLKRNMIRLRKEAWTKALGDLALS